MKGPKDSNPRMQETGALGAPTFNTTEGEMRNRFLERNILLFKQLSSTWFILV